jgi:hypothetical protein
MRRLLPVFLLLVALPARATIAYVPASATTGAYATASSGTALTLTAATTAGDDVIVGLSWHTASVSIKKIVGSAAGSFFVVYSQYAGSSSAGTVSAIAVCVRCAALTTITPTFSGSTKCVINVAEYSSVAWLGTSRLAAGTSTASGITFSTGDANDWVVVETASTGTTNPASGAGNLRAANNTGASGVAAALIDNTSASPGSVAASAAIASGAWSAAGIELRTAALKTYIWPDCDTSHPCLIYHYSRPAQPLEADGPLFKFWVRPSLAGNLLVLTITHPGIINTIADAGGNTWTAGASTKGSEYTTEVRYVCGAPAGSGGEIDITLAAAITDNDLMQVNYDEYSGVAGSVCSNSAAAAIAQPMGAVQPGVLSAAIGNTYLVYAYGIDGTGNQSNSYPSGRNMPDDLSADIWDSSNDAFLSTTSVQTATGTAITPTLNVTGMDISRNADTWQAVGEAFSAAAGSGTQPSPGQAWVVRDIITWNNPAASLALQAGPTNGNAIVTDSTHFQTIYSLGTLVDNSGGTYAANPMPDTTADPQQYVDCLGTGGGVNRDRTFAYTPSNYSTIFQYYDIAGAKTSGGATGCIGNEVNNRVGFQANTNNANIVTAGFSAPWSFAPALNANASSVVILDIGFGTGPPAGPCNSGGVTPPTCTNDMAGVVFGSVWATNMGDGSHYTTGDFYGWYQATTTTAKSFDTFMANSGGQPGGGTGSTGAVVEILGQPRISGERHRAWVVGQ